MKKAAFSAIALLLFVTLVTVTRYTNDTVELGEAAATSTEHAVASASGKKLDSSSSDSISAKFDAVHQKALAKSEKIPTYEDEAAKKSSEFVEVLPYLLPPCGIAILLLLGLTVYAVRRWQMSNPGGMGMRPMGPAR